MARANHQDAPEGERIRPIRIPVAQHVLPHLSLIARLQDPLARIDRVPVVNRSFDWPEVGPELTELAEMSVCPLGGSLRRFSGGLNHLCGWYPSYKRHRLQHWEGIAQHDMLMLAECDWSIEWAQSEARRFSFTLNGRLREYTCDIELRTADGTIEILELKSDERHLEDPEYRLTLAGVAEICRRIGFRFRVLFSDEIFESHCHRENVELFSSRRFKTVSKRHIRTLDAFALNHGLRTSYGHLASILEPNWPPAGKAVVQALVVHRRIKLDLTQLITDETTVEIC